mmetsp:Transcript_28233/g.83158  ORF Transcript_28233/g.83158 Transcript_28233/m.83158 type:complete len:270 (+) Transcript_28233:76-885(+)
MIAPVAITQYMVHTACNEPPESHAPLFNVLRSRLSLSHLLASAHGSRASAPPTPRSRWLSEHPIQQARGRKVELDAKVRVVPLVVRVLARAAVQLPLGQHEPRLAQHGGVEPEGEELVVVHLAARAVGHLHPHVGRQQQRARLCVYVDHRDVRPRANQLARRAEDEGCHRRVGAAPLWRRWRPLAVAVGEGELARGHPPHRPRLAPPRRRLWDVLGNLDAEGWPLLRDADRQRDEAHPHQPAGGLPVQEPLARGGLAAEARVVVHVQPL